MSILELGFHYSFLQVKVDISEILIKYLQVTMRFSVFYQVQ